MTRRVCLVLLSVQVLLLMMGLGVMATSLSPEQIDQKLVAISNQHVLLGVLLTLNLLSVLALLVALTFSIRRARAGLACK